MFYACTGWEDGSVTGCGAENGKPEKKKKKPAKLVPTVKNDKSQKKNSVKGTSWRISPLGWLCLDLVFQAPTHWLVSSTLPRTFRVSTTPSQYGSSERDDRGRGTPTVERLLPSPFRRHHFDGIVLLLLPHWGGRV